MPLPNFLIIGAHKSGTTSLYRYLNQHPDVYMSQVKEPAYFVYEGDKVKYQEFDGSPWRSRFITLEDYEALFEGVQSEVAVGEASTLYLYHPRAPLRIKEHIPDAKLIAILRNPVDRAYSNYQFARMQGREPLGTFREALEAEEERITAGWAPLWHYTKKGFYSEQITRYRAIFPEDQLRIYLYDDLRFEPDRLVHDIFDFLGVNSEVRVQTGETYNVTRQPRYVSFYTLLRRGARLIGPLRKIIPKKMNKKIQRWLFTDQTSAPVSIPTEDKNFLMALYEEEIVELQSLLQRNLESWQAD